VSAPAPPPLPSLAGRIRLSLLKVTLFGIAVVTAAALAIGYHALERLVRSHLATLAATTATQSQAAALFRDREAAMEVLRSIPKEQGISVAELRDPAGAVIARVAHEDQTVPGPLAPAFSLGHVSADVVVDGRKVGRVVLVDGGRPLLRSLLDFLVLDLLGALVTGLVVLAIARRLTRHITQPLTELGAVIRGVRADRDFGRRAPGGSVAEIEELRADFNALLDEIQRRDHDLNRTNAALKRLAFRDPLTGLANRAMFENALLAALRAEGGAGRPGLLYFDLDSFKAVNDTFGHLVGDALLKAIAARLEAELPPSALPARIGGDEFVVLIGGIATEDELRAIAERLQEALQAPLRAGPQILYPGLSVGYALSPQNGAAADELIHLADRAMYVSKSRRREAGVHTRWETVPHVDHRSLKMLFDQIDAVGEPAARNEATGMHPGVIDVAKKSA